MAVGVTTCFRLDPRATVNPRDPWGALLLGTRCRPSLSAAAGGGRCEEAGPLRIAGREAVLAITDVRRAPAPDLIGCRCSACSCWLAASASTLHVINHAPRHSAAGRVFVCGRLDPAWSHWSRWVRSLDERVPRACCVKMLCGTRPSRSWRLPDLLPDCGASVLAEAGCGPRSPFSKGS